MKTHIVQQSNHRYDKISKNKLKSELQKKRMGPLNDEDKLQVDKKRTTKLKFKKNLKTTNKN